jgi:hypothetical protein
VKSDAHTAPIARAVLPMTAIFDMIGFRRAWLDALSSYWLEACSVWLSANSQQPTVVIPA